MLLKLFPHCFAAVPSEDALSLSQWHWLQGQMLLDGGMAACPACDVLGSGRFCRACGTSLHGEVEVLHACPQCRQTDVGPYCPSCGTLLVSTAIQQLEAGTYDWDAWRASLEPFLHGLTPGERALFNGDGHG
jgi:hypothetical protein